MEAKDYQLRMKTCFRCTHLLNRTVAFFHEASSPNKPGWVWFVQLIFKWLSCQLISLSHYHFFCQSFSLVLCRAAVLFFLVTPCFNSSYVSTTQFCLRIARTSCYLDFSNLCWIRLIVWIWIELYGTTLAPTDLLGCVWQFLQLSETENLTCTPTLIIGHLCRANKISRAWTSLFISFIIIDTAISVTFYAYNWVQHYEYHKCMLLSPHINNEASPISYYFHFYF